MSTHRPALLRAACAALLIACAACRAAGADSAPDALLDAGNPEDVIRAQEEAWNRGDVEAFAALGYWRSPELSFFSGGDRTLGYDAMVARYRARYTEGDAEMGRLAFDDLETVILADDACIVRGRWDLDFERSEDVGGLFTLVMRRLPEGWRVVHDHTSVDS